MEFNQSDSTSGSPPYGASQHYMADAGRTYFESQGKTGAIASQWNLPIWQRYLTSSDTVLDFGCGGGQLLKLLNVAQKIGVEINPAARHDAESVGVMVVSSLDELPPQKFTRIISSHALEHVPHPLVALQAFSEYLASNGKLILLLPMDDWRSKGHHRYQPGNFDHHLYNWTPQNLGNLLEEASYQVEELRIITDAMPPYLGLSSRLLGMPSLKTLVGYLFSVLRNRRQLLAVASNKTS